MAASATVDAIGVPFYENTRGTASGSMSVENVRKVVGYGKPVIVWEIHRRSVHQRFRALGVRGFMCPDPYWITGGNLDPNLKLGEGRRLHGMIPAEVTNPRDMPDYSRGVSSSRRASCSSSWGCRVRASPRWCACSTD